MSPNQASVLTGDVAIEDGFVLEFVPPESPSEGVFGPDAEAGLVCHVVAILTAHEMPSSANLVAAARAVYPPIPSAR